MLECIDHGQKGNANGYGYTSRYVDGKRVVVGLHRAAYCDAHGLPYSAIKGKVVMHRCDNPRCINPDHLVLGTQGDNMQDMMGKRRHHKGEATPHAKLTSEQVVLIRKLYAEGGVTQRELALELGVSQTNISAIVRGETFSVG